MEQLRADVYVAKGVWDLDKVDDAPLLFVPAPSLLKTRIPRHDFASGRVLFPGEANKTATPGANLAHEDGFPESLRMSASDGT